MKETKFVKSDKLHPVSLVLLVCKIRTQCDWWRKNDDILDHESILQYQKQSLTLDKYDVSSTGGIKCK